MTAKTVVIHDPAIGVRKLPLADVSKHFTGVVLELTPAASFRPVHARAPDPPVQPLVADDGYGARARPGDRAVGGDWEMGQLGWFTQTQDAGYGKALIAIYAGYALWFAFGIFLMYRGFP
jgi:hypothetical protein